MRLRPREVRLVQQMLESEEWEDEKECATAIIERLDQHREQERVMFCLAVQYATGSGPVTLMYGPFGTRVEAERAYRKGMGQVSENGKVQVFQMTSPALALAALEA